jgi:hypothetical protein
MIQKAQTNLKTLVKLDLVDGWAADPVPHQGDDQVTFSCKSARALEKRQAASWSCHFVAAALNLATLLAKKNIDDSNTSDSNREQLGPLKAYAFSYLKAIQQNCVCSFLASQTCRSGEEISNILFYL